MGEGLGADLERQAHRSHGPSPLIGGEQRSWRQRERRGLIGALAGEYVAAGRPAFEPRRPDANSLNINPHGAARPSMRLQLLPPKPKELLMTRATRPDRVSSR